jgi:hypothetical protein
LASVFKEVDIRSFIKPVMRRLRSRRTVEIMNICKAISASAKHMLDNVAQTYRVAARSSPGLAAMVSTCKVGDNEELLGEALRSFCKEC